MKTQTFGIEIELNHISREKAARVIAATIPGGGTVRHPGGGYDKWRVTGVDGRSWSVGAPRSRNWRGVYSQSCA